LRGNARELSASAFPLRNGHHAAWVGVTCRVILIYLRSTPQKGFLAKETKTIRLPWLPLDVHQWQVASGLLEVEMDRDENAPTSGFEEPCAYVKRPCQHATTNA